MFVRFVLFFAAVVWLYYIGVVGAIARCIVVSVVLRCSDALCSCVWYLAFFFFYVMYLLCWCVVLARQMACCVVFCCVVLTQQMRCVVSCDVVAWSVM